MGVKRIIYKQNKHKNKITKNINVSKNIQQFDKVQISENIINIATIDKQLIGISKEIEKGQIKQTFKISQGHEIQNIQISSCHKIDDKIRSKIMKLVTTISEQIQLHPK
jgi:hypothetical protein